MKYAYDSIPVNELQRAQIQEVREAFSALSEILDKHTPPGRYRSIVETDLEKAQMMAVKSITHAAGGYDQKAA